MKAILQSYGFVITGPVDEVEFVYDKSEVAAACKALAAKRGYDPEDYAVNEVFMKGFTFDRADYLETRMEKLFGVYKRGWDEIFKEQAMKETAELPNPLNKPIMDWGYHHGLMLTNAQVDDLIATLNATPIPK